MAKSRRGSKEGDDEDARVSDKVGSKKIAAGSGFRCMQSVECACTFLLRDSEYVRAGRVPVAQCPPWAYGTCPE